jgi:hypothetical protein
MQMHSSYLKTKSALGKKSDQICSIYERSDWSMDFSLDPLVNKSPMHNDCNNIPYITRFRTAECIAARTVLS